MNNEWYSRVSFLSSLLASLLLILVALRMETCLFGNVSEISELSQIMLVWPKWPNTTFFGNFQKKTPVSEINGKLPLFPKLEFQKLEFLINSAIVALLSWICVIKKNYVVLELGKLKYHATQYSSIPTSSTFYK